MTRTRPLTRRRELALIALASAPVALSLASAASAAPVTAGNLVVYRVGTGTGSLVNTGNPVSLDEYTPAGVLVQSIPLPSASVGSNRPCVASGTATSEGFLTRSADSTQVLAMCYGTTTGGTASLSGTASTAVPRVLAEVDSTGAVDTSTALGDFASGNNPRSAAGISGSPVYAGGAGTPGVGLATKSASTSTPITNPAVNARQLVVAGGNLYYSTGSGTRGVYQVGSGLPTTGPQTGTLLPGLDSGAATSPYGFSLLDLDGTPGVETAYVADDASGTIGKYRLVSGTWTAVGSVAFAGARGLTTQVVGSSGVRIYATTGGSAATGGGSLVGLLDANAPVSTLSGTPTTLATAGTNTAFRGVALAPVPASVPTTVVPEVPLAAVLPLIGLTAVGAVSTVRRRRTTA